MYIKVIALTLNTFIALIIGFRALRKFETPGAASLIVLSLFLAIWSLVYLLYEELAFYFSGLFLIAVNYFISTIIASAQLTFCLSFTNRGHWITRPALVLLGAVPVLTQILFWIMPKLNVVFTDLNAQMSYLTFANIWEKFINIYIYSLLGISVLLLANIFIRKPGLLRTPAWTILPGSVFPLAFQAVNITGLLRPSQIDSSLFAYTLAVLGFSYNLFNHPSMEIMALRREEAIERMEDGWILLDTQNKIVDMNPAAERIIGLPRRKLYGEAINSALNDFPNLGLTAEGTRELEMKRSVKSQNGWNYLNIRILSLAGRQKNNIGRLVVWTDITDRKMAEDARQRARDEMFVILNAISSAASQAINLEDFLSESIYQMIYPFRSQAVAIFLMDERKNNDQEERLFLASHFGLSPDAINGMTYLPVSTPFVRWVFENRRPLLVENTGGDLAFPPAMRETDLSCLLAVPLITRAGEENKTIGLLCLARMEKPIYSQDEIIRLIAISDHIATLIDSDRRRKLAIALSERQRLLRDLHDSVSQKLYGLVTMTEAAQAALDAGSAVNPSQVLSRIGDNARQAVKEMRLFLYQMQPIDVEKDGLISVLHHRLAAVEGRADIKARLLADENVSLSKDKEIALYFIAQEALNNVLRHAHARSVTVILKQGRENVILKILDDGRGFDLKTIDRAGLGLQNMQERALQIRGKLKIISKPGEGTKIIMTVRREQYIRPKPSRRRSRS